MNQKKTDNLLEKIQTLEKDKLQPYIGLALLIVSAYFLWLLFRSYAWDAFFALLLYIGFYQFNHLIIAILSKSKLKLPTKTIAALTSTTLAFSLIIVPFSLLVRQLILESYELINKLQLAIANGTLMESLTKLPYLSEMVTLTPFFWVEIFNSLSDITHSYISYINPQQISSWSGNFFILLQGGLQLTFTSLFHLILIVTSLFFLLKDGSSVYQFLRMSIPLPTNVIDHFTKRMYQTTLDLLQGSVFVAIVQGTALAIVLAFLDFSNVVSYGVVAAIFSVVPIIGTSIIWLPCALYLATFEMRLGAAIFLAIYGFSVYFALDNIVKPKFLDSKLGIHPMLLFLAIMGGLAEFGFVGIIVGPIFLMLFKMIWNIYRI